MYFIFTSSAFDDRLRIVYDNKSCLRNDKKEIRSPESYSILRAFSGREFLKACFTKEEVIKYCADYLKLEK